LQKSATLIAYQKATVYFFNHSFCNLRNRISSVRLSQRVCTRHSTTEIPFIPKPASRLSIERSIKSQPRLTKPGSPA
jgi:hypothetical protein